jgi:hypothetical protein
MLVSSCASSTLARIADSLKPCTWNLLTRTLSKVQAAPGHVACTITIIFEQSTLCHELLNAQSIVRVFSQARRKNHNGNSSCFSAWRISECMLHATRLYHHLWCHISHRKPFKNHF